MPSTRVCSLTCAKYFEMSHACLGSFIRNAKGYTQLDIMDDGTLTEEQQAQLCALGSGVQIITKSERDAACQERLSAYPRCWAYRNQTPFGQKLLDVPLQYADGFIFLDSDILFINQFDLNTLDANECFIGWENDQGYSGPLLSVRKVRDRLIPSGGNTGFFKLPRTRFDLDFIEWFLGQSKLTVIPGMVEQTVFSLLVGLQNSWQLDPAQFPADKDVICPDENTIALHFVYRHKRRWKEYLHWADAPQWRDIRLHRPKPISHSYIIKRRAIRYWNEKLKTK